MQDKPLIFFDPYPRNEEMVFTNDVKTELEKISNLIYHFGSRAPDELVDKNIEEIEILVGQTAMPKERLDKSKKTILYAPTFYPSSLEKLGLSLGDITSVYNLIIKPHMWTYYLDSFGGISLKGQRSLIFKLIDQFDHIRLLEPAEYNVTPYYKISDLLLTDASSTIYEMIALSKPVVVNRFYHLKLSHRIFQKRLYKRSLDKEMNDEVEKFCFLAG